MDVGADPGSAREWCAVAVARLDRDQPEAALEAARRAVEGGSPAGDAGAGGMSEWGYRIASLAFERLGRDAESVAAAEEAVRLAPGSWAARLRLGTALRRIPGRWKEAWVQAGRAARYAPEEPDPHVLVGDLSLLRGEYRQARAAYRQALRRLDDHPGARINLGLAFLRWERSRGHHDPAWPVDPRATGRARRALEAWSRQVRVLLAAALLAVAAVAAGAGLTGGARAGGGAVLAAVLVITFRQAHRVRLWAYVPAMLVRDAWLALSVAVTLAAVAAYVAALATLPGAVPALASGSAAALARSPWSGLAGLVLLNGAAVLVVRTLAEAWRGRPVRALAEFAAAGGDRTARRDTDVTLWLVAVRAWSVLAAVAGAALVLDDSRWSFAALAVPAALRWAYGRAGRTRRREPAGDRWLAAVTALLAAASLAFGAAAAARALELPDRFDRWAWQAGIGALVAVVAAYVTRSARAWWRGAPGPWRGSLAMCENCGRRLPGDVRAPVGLSGEVRRAIAGARGVVLAYADPTGPRALAVGSVGSVGPDGELRLIAADDAWQAAERDPRVAVFVGDPLDRRFWAEVRGIAIADAEADVLRVTPKHVVVGEYPGRHQGRVRPRDGRPAR
ncbi:hypothetical protein [Planomonospora venezuelensis]|uniref:Tetratricopeptide repeat protein n=1 Tax=Planomonospora venezuelensis TaxID=1999 RepID=A0A841D5J1_PLAVE|nr:hypothetical protein [Planomonospora venezuelensis]